MCIAVPLNTELDIGCHIVHHKLWGIPCKKITWCLVFNLSYLENNIALPFIFCFQNCFEKLYTFLTLSFFHFHRHLFWNFGAFSVCIMGFTLGLIFDGTLHRPIVTTRTIAIWWPTFDEFIWNYKKTVTESGAIRIITKLKDEIPDRIRINV